MLTPRMLHGTRARKEDASPRGIASLHLDSSIQLAPVVNRVTSVQMWSLARKHRAPLSHPAPSGSQRVDPSTERDTKPGLGPKPHASFRRPTEVASGGRSTGGGLAAPPEYRKRAAARSCWRAQTEELSDGNHGPCTWRHVGLRHQAGPARRGLGADFSLGCEATLEYRRGIEACRDRKQWGGSASSAIATMRACEGRSAITETASRSTSPESCSQNNRRTCRRPAVECFRRPLRGENVQVEYPSRYDAAAVGLEGRPSSQAAVVPDRFAALMNDPVARQNRANAAPRHRRQCRIQMGGALLRKGRALT